MITLLAMFILLPTDVIMGNAVSSGFQVVTIQKPRVPSSGRQNRHRIIHFQHHIRSISVIEQEKWFRKCLFFSRISEVLI